MSESLQLGLVGAGTIAALLFARDRKVNTEELEKNMTESLEWETKHNALNPAVLSALSST